MAYDLLRSVFCQAEDGIRAAQESRGLGDVYKRQPLRHAAQVLSHGLKPPTTKSPGLTVVTASPTASTTPQYSWPMGVGFGKGDIPRERQRSEPQTQAATTRMTASVGSMMVGSGRSS